MMVLRNLIIAKAFLYSCYIRKPRYVQTVEFPAETLRIGKKESTLITKRTAKQCS